jgi:hypothetical protein
MTRFDAAGAEQRADKGRRRFVAPAISTACPAAAPTSRNSLAITVAGSRLARIFLAQGRGTITLPADLETALLLRNARPAGKRVISTLC